MTAEIFFKSFMKKIEDNKSEAIETYPYNKEFTKFIISKINEILGNSEDDRLVQNEYYRIDVIKWRECKNEITHDCHLRNHLWDLQVAVEHENDSRDWMDEVTKLAHIFCDLRVIIGYLPYKKRENGEDDRCLDYIANSLQKLACYGNVKRENSEFLIIIGNSETGGAKKRFFGYKGYLFDTADEKFKEI